MVIIKINRKVFPFQSNIVLIGMKNNFCGVRNRSPFSFIQINVFCTEQHPMSALAWKKKNKQRRGKSTGRGRSCKQTLTIKAVSQKKIDHLFNQQGHMVPSCLQDWYGSCKICMLQNTTWKGHFAGWDHSFALLDPYCTIRQRKRHSASARH